MKLEKRLNKIVAISVLLIFSFSSTGNVNTFTVPPGSYKGKVGDRKDYVYTKYLEDNISERQF